jgi:predicted Zn-dependent protease
MTVDLRCIRKGGRIFTFMSAAAEADFQSYVGAIDLSSRSFKTLTDARYVNRKPLRLALVRSRGGSLQSLLQAEGMGQKLWKDASFMNGYALDQAVPSNSFVKIAR